MNKIRITLGLAGAAVLFSLGDAHAQILYVSVRAPKSPVPPMPLLVTNAAPPNPTAPAAVPSSRRRVAPLQPSVDKAELERRVVAFQKKRARQGFSDAQYQLALRYLEGRGVDQNPAAAREWLVSAAAKGHARAEEKLEEIGSPDNGAAKAGSE